MKLPKKLGKVPLVGAVFEMRFHAKAPASNILPGLIFSRFEGEKTVEKLPTAELPEAIRNVDPNLQYAPLVSIRWDNFVILVSDRSAMVTCGIVYPGWTAFKAAILQLVGLVGEAAIVEFVERFSLKYTNVFSHEMGSAPSVMEFQLTIGTRDVRDKLFQIRVELPGADLISIVQIAAEGTANFPDGKMIRGVVFDVDTVSTVSNTPFSAFADALADRLERAHSEAKATFVACLKPSALERLEPVYD